MKSGRVFSNLWIAVVVFAISSIVAAAFALGAQIVGLLLWGTVVLAIADLLGFRARGGKI